MSIEIELKKTGKYLARVNNLEIIIFYNTLSEGFSTDISVYEDITEVPCEYEGCPSGKKSNTCDFYTGEIQLCPHKEIEEQCQIFTSFSSNTYSETKDKITSMFRNGNDGLGHKSSWPKKETEEYLSQHLNI